MPNTNYPKLVRALDELLSEQVAKWGESVIEFALASMAKEPEPVKFEEKLPPVPVTKEVVDGG